LDVDRDFSPEKTGQIAADSSNRGRQLRKIAKDLRDILLIGLNRAFTLNLGH
jgi:hypothetical protein